MSEDYSGGETPGTRINEALQRNSDSEAFNTQSLDEESLKNGNQWTLSEVVTLDNAGTEQVFINNSLTSRVIRVIGLTLDPTERISGTWSENVTQDTAGTDFDYLNNYATDPSQDPPPFDMHLGGTYSGTGNGYTFESAAGPEAIGVNQRGTAAPQAAVSRIEPGANRHLEIESLADGNPITIQATISTKPPAGGL